MPNECFNSVKFQPDSDISDYTYERTLVMEERYKMLRDMHLKDRDLQFDIQTAVADAAHERKLSRIQEDDAAGDKQGASAAAPGSHQSSPSRPIPSIPEEKESAPPADKVSQVRFSDSAHVSPISPKVVGFDIILDYFRRLKTVRMAPRRQGTNLPPETDRMLAIRRLRRPLHRKAPTGRRAVAFPTRA